MNPVSAHNSSELKASTPYSNVPTNSSSSQDLMTTAGQQQQQPQQQQQQQSRTSYACTPTASTASSFTPLANVDASTIGSRGSGTDYCDYLSHLNGLNNNTNTPSFSSSLMLDSDHYNSAARLPMSSGISVVPPGAPHIPPAYVSSSHFPAHGLTSKLSDLQFPNTASTGVSLSQSGIPPGPMEMAYSAPHMMSVLASSPHASIISPAYSPCSVTTQGSGGVGASTRGGSNKRSLGACASVSIDADNKPGAFKARSKKESHNRIERRRRDYINSQISRLSSLLPPEMYHDVDGRRNKGTVLRLSVAYIMDLRNDLVQTAAIRQEANLARTLIPQLSSYIQSLETALKEAEIATGKTLRPITGVLDDSIPSYQNLLDSWELLARTNSSRPTNGESTSQSKMESEMPSSLENMQTAFCPTTASTTTNNPSLNSYHPNAVFVGGPICKQEETDDMCYGSSHVPDDTTDGFYDSTSTSNTNQNSSSTTTSVTKYDLSLMPQLTPSGQVDCGNHDNPMQNSQGTVGVLQLQAPN